MSAITVFGNDWSRLVPATDSRWTPSRTVSICIPARNPGAGLRRTLLALSAQTYPVELIEVVIADDGSVPAISLPDELPYACRIVKQEQTLQFGAGQARNTAARAAKGEILMFLDGDVIPERQVVATYCRWFERSDLVVPMGLCNFVDTGDLTGERLADLIATGTMEKYFSGAEVDDQRWRETTFRRTNDLREEAIDAFRIVIGATFAVSRAQFEVVGGFRELGIRGVEDTEFGYRLHANGAILVLDRDAIHWHQGRRNLSSERRAEIDRVRRPYVEALIPIPGFRGPDPEPIAGVDIVPAFEVRPSGASVREGFEPTFATVWLPDELLWTADAEKRVRRLFREHPVGVIRVLSSTEGVGIIDIVRTRALRRAYHVRPDDDAIMVAAELFGVWWADAESLGIIEYDNSRDSAVDKLPETTSLSSRSRQIYARSRWRFRKIIASAYSRFFDRLKKWAQ